MAIYNKLVKGGNGIDYTKECDNSSDYPAMPNSTTFKNLFDGLIYRKNVAGDVFDIFEGNISNPSATSYIEKTKTEIDILISGNDLVKGALYKISDCAISLYGGTTIITKALSDNKLSEECSGIFYNPKYSKVNPGYDIFNDVSIWDLTNIVGSFELNELVTADNLATGRIFKHFGLNRFIALTGDMNSATSITGDSSGTTADVSVSTLVSYNTLDVVHWGGKSWTNNAGVTGSPIDILTLSSDWTVIPFNTTDYNVVYDDIEYDYLNDTILARSEEFSNIVKCSLSASQWFDYHPIKAFQWGNLLEPTYETGIGEQDIQDSYNENINFRGTMQRNISMHKLSYQKDFYFDETSRQLDISFNNESYQANMVFLESSYQSAVTLDNYAYQEVIMFSVSSYMDSISLDNSSFQQTILFIDSSYQVKLAFNNDSKQINLNFNAFCSQENLSFANDSGQYGLIFTAYSTQKKFTFTDGAYHDTLTFDGSSQEYFNFSNRSHQNNIECSGGSAQRAFNFTNESDQHAVVLVNSSTQNHLTFDNLSNQYNLDFNTSEQQDITLTGRSYQRDLTFTGTAQQLNITCNDYSYQENIIIDNNSFQQYLTLKYSSHQLDITLLNGSTQTHLELSNGSYQFNVSFDKGSYQEFIKLLGNSYQRDMILTANASHGAPSYQKFINISDNSYQININLSNATYQANITLSNLSYLDDIVMVTGGYQDSLTLRDKSYIKTVNLSDISYQLYITLTNVSYLDWITLSLGSYQMNFTFNNGSYIKNHIINDTSFQKDITLDNGSYMPGDASHVLVQLDGSSHQQYLNFTGFSRIMTSQLESGSVMEQITCTNEGVISAYHAVNGGSMLFVKLNNAGIGGTNNDGGVMSQINIDNGTLESTDLLGTIFTYINISSESHVVNINNVTNGGGGQVYGLTLSNNSFLTNFDIDGTGVLRLLNLTNNSTIDDVNIDDSVTYANILMNGYDYQASGLTISTNTSGQVFNGDYAITITSAGTMVLVHENNEIKTYELDLLRKSLNIQSIISSGTITPDAVNDIVDVTALAVNTTIANGTGIPTDKQVLEIHILDAGVSKTINVGTNYVWYVTAITATTAGKRLIMFCEYSLVDAKWLILKTITQP